MPAIVNASVTAKAPKHEVWKILADFPNIANYVSSVRSSASTSDTPFDVGSARHCEFAPAGSADETILEINEGERLVISITPSGAPFKHSVTTFALNEIDANTTELTFHSELEPKGWILSGIVARILERRLPKGAQQVIAELASAAEKANQS